MVRLTVVKSLFQVHYIYSEFQREPACVAVIVAVLCPCIYRQAFLSLWAACLSYTKNISNIFNVHKLLANLTTVINIKITYMMQ